MARKRISEFRAKTLLYNTLDIEYAGISVTIQADEHGETHHFFPSAIEILDTTKQYVVKVDQGIKGRFKKGLVKLHQPVDQITKTIQELHAKGYSQFLIEAMTAHHADEEKYLSIERTKRGYKVLYSDEGGINIEDNHSSIKEVTIPYNDANISDYRAIIQGIETVELTKLLEAFDKFQFSFLEINPFIIDTSRYLLLDAAVEVDSTAAFFVSNAWTETDFVTGQIKSKTKEEHAVQQLAANSQAAFSFEVLNKNGSIFMMLSGGGASIVLADEVHNQGYGKALANYGEYSGNPTAEETYMYAKNILSLLLASTAEKKILIIAGGVANFTDVRKTFIGVIKAIDEMKEEMQKQHINVFVRRGGPYQEEGLAHMRTFLQKNNILGIIAGPEMILTEIVSKALESIKEN